MSQDYPNAIDLEIGKEALGKAEGSAPRQTEGSGDSSGSEVEARAIMTLACGGVIDFTDWTTSRVRVHFRSSAGQLLGFCGGHGDGLDCSHGWRKVAEVSDWDLFRLVGGLWGLGWVEDDGPASLPVTPGATSGVDENVARTRGGDDEVVEWFEAIPGARVLKRTDSTTDGTESLAVSERLRELQLRVENLERVMRAAGIWSQADRVGEIGQARHHDDLEASAATAATSVSDPAYPPRLPRRPASISEDFEAPRTN